MPQTSERISAQDALGAAQESYAGGQSPAGSQERAGSQDGAASQAHAEKQSHPPKYPVSPLAFWCACAPIAIALYLLACTLFLLAPPRAGASSGLATMFDKHRRLHTLPSGKIVLIGGSNVSTGIDSEAIEKALHLNVVNMGLGASLGLRYMMQEVKDDIRPGDLLVILPEYDYFLDISRSSNAHLNGSSDLFQLAQAFPPSIKWIAVDYLGSPTRLCGGLEDLQHFIATKKNFYGIIFKRYKDSHFTAAISDLLQPGSTIYTQRQNYNKYGDFMGICSSSRPALAL